MKLLLVILLCCAASCMPRRGDGVNTQLGLLNMYSDVRYAQPQSQSRKPTVTIKDDQIIISYR